MVDAIESRGNGRAGRPILAERPRLFRRRAPASVGGTPALAYWLLLPALTGVAFLVAYPIYLVFQMALRPGVEMDFLSIHTHPLGLDNFREVLTDQRTWAALWRTVVYTVGSVVPGFVIGLGLALLLNRSFPGRRWLRSLILLPWAVPGVIVSILYLWLLDSTYGIVNALLRQSGLISADIGWFTRPETAMAAVILPTVWKVFPFFTLTILAALQSIPLQLYEAAKVDGAGPLASFRFVTWPGIRGAVVLAGILQTLWVLREFDIIYATTGGGPVGATETLGLLIYNEAFSYFRMGTASAMGVLLLAVSLVLVLLALKPLRKEYF